MNSYKFGKLDERVEWKNSGSRYMFRIEGKYWGYATIPNLKLPRTVGVLYVRTFMQNSGAIRVVQSRTLHEAYRDWLMAFCVIEDIWQEIKKGATLSQGWPPFSPRDITMACEAAWTIPG